MKVFMGRPLQHHAYFVQCGLGIDDTLVTLPETVDKGAFAGRSDASKRSS